MNRIQSSLLLKVLSFQRNKFVNNHVQSQLHRLFMIKRVFTCNLSNIQIQSNEQKFNLQMLEDIIKNKFIFVKNDMKILIHIWNDLETYLLNEKDGYFDQLIQNPNMWEGFMQIISKKLNEELDNTKKESLMNRIKVRLLYSLYAQQAKKNGYFESNKYFHLLKSYVDFLRQKSSNEEDTKLSTPHVILSSMHLKFKNDILEGRNIENDFISDVAFNLKALQKTHQLDNLSLLTEDMQICATFGMIFDKQQWKKPIERFINLKDEDLGTIYKFKPLMNLVMMSCILNKDLSPFDELINKILRRENLFFPSVLEFQFHPHTIKIYLQTFSEKKYLMQLFKSFLKLKIVLDQKSIEFIKTHMKKLGVTYSETEIDDNGFCKVSNKKLQRFQITENDIVKLKEILKSYLLNGKLSYKYCNTKDFEEFEHNIMKYSVVIDGLNVIFKNTHKCDSHNKRINYITKLKNICAQLRKKYQNLPFLITIRDRTFLKFFELNNLERKYNAHMFYLDQLAKDDTFILYAALCSGPDAKILTNDLFRDHLYRLIGAGRLFERWLASITIRFDYTSKIPTLIGPPEYEAEIQKIDNHWYIPYSYYIPNADKMNEKNKENFKKKWLYVNLE